MARTHILLSGGIDSSTCLALSAASSTTTAISVHYGQLHTVELSHATSIAKHFKVNHEIVDMSGVIGKGGLSDPDLDVPEVDYADLPQGISPTYVPNRNMLMLAMLASKASVDPEAELIAYGAHAEDAENDAYPDCSKEFVEHMQKVIRIATYDKLTLQAPFVNMTKAEVIRIGEKFNVPWKLTWSCYKGGIIHCGICSTCRARKSAFKDADVKDPTSYQGEDE